MTFRRFTVLVLLLSLTAWPQRLQAREKRLTLVAVGDVNLNRHRTEVRGDGMMLWGKLVPFEKPLKKIRRYINGDINFCNLETTVMDRNDIKPADKTYNFKTHPEAVKVLQEVGFNLMALANNHIRDYGSQGVSETRKWLHKLAKKKKLWFAGAGEDIDEATAPTVFKVNGIKVAFAAVGNSQAATKKRAGVASVYKPDLALKRLKEADADVRILSMHCGKEKETKPIWAQFQTARRAIKDYDVDVVIGHHAHVVQGIEYYRGGLIFYGMGNFSMRGARNMGSVKEFRFQRDFGLLAQIELVYDTHKKSVRFDKVKVLPVYDMHSGVRPFTDKESAERRVTELNGFSTDKFLGGKGTGLNFVFKDGWGECVFKEGKPNAHLRKKEASGATFPALPMSGD